MKKTLVIAVATVMIAMLLTLQSHTSMIVYASPGDSYGNDILWVAVYQNSNNLKANLTSSGGSVRLDANVAVSFVVKIKFNSTLAGSQSEAVQYTKVVMNITYNNNYIWLNKELNNTSVQGPVNGFYYLTKVGNWTSSLPQAGVTYICSIEYYANY